ncbi:MAG: ATP-binding protein [Bifidobacterium pullorum]
MECGWLLFGVTNKREICGTAYRQEQRHPSVGLRSLKHEIAENLNNGLTLEEIYEFDVDGKRVVAFQIPPCEFASPTTWRDIPWSRENESLVQMPRFKLEAVGAVAPPTGRKSVIRGESRRPRS